MWNFLGWKVDVISFPTSIHGPSYLLGIKSYSCFFWWSELVIRSDLVLFWVRSGALFFMCNLITTNVEHLGSITSLEVIKAQSVRNEFICSCSFLARRLVSGPWFVSLMFDVEFLTFEVSCSVGMSSSLPSNTQEASAKKKKSLSQTRSVLWSAGHLNCNSPNPAAIVRYIFW